MGEPHRQHWTFPGAFATESGASIESPTSAYETWGALDAEGANAVLLTTGLSPSAHAARHDPGDDPGWWEEMVGPGKALDTGRWFVVCANVLGGCHGSTGPASPDPGTGAPYALRFPVITLRDIMRIQRALLEALGVERLHAVVGSSMGGMLALEYAALFPGTVNRLIAISASGLTHPFAIALRRVQRRAVMLDPAWKGGDYYGHDPPAAGLSLAREIGTITYRSDLEWTRRFGRAWQDGELHSLSGRFEIESYLAHQGEKYARAYDANSYLYLSRAMDLHDLGRGRGGLEAAVGRITARTLLIGVETDVLIPRFEIEELARAFSAVGRPAELHMLDLDTGHDSFLIHPDAFGSLVRRHLEAPRLSSIRQHGAGGPLI
ncbi:MAG TPA: homoserine O-acetyltransferase [Gemmatimonadota bacterium]|nr:homoserine O-acetyltransferase [Gemmatimonadota bacterium]